MDETLKILSNSSRRQISQELANSRRKEADLDQLSRLLVENQDINPDTALISLKQVHLPKMEQYGLIEFDEERNTVSYDEDEIIEGFHEEFEDLSTTDDTLDLLSDSYRRQISYNFVESGREEISVDELVEYFSENKGIDNKTARLKLQHAHLPKMEAEGFLNHDREQDVVTYEWDEETRNFISRIKEFEQKYKVENV